MDLTLISSYCRADVAGFALLAVILLSVIQSTLELCVSFKVVACELERGEFAVLQQTVGMATYLNARLLFGIRYAAFTFASVWYDLAGEELRLVVESVTWWTQGDTERLSCFFGSPGGWDAWDAWVGGEEVGFRVV